MLIIPKLPMRNKAVTKAFYTELLGFIDIGAVDYPQYLILSKEGAELHFFSFESLVIKENYGQIYIRVLDIKSVYNDFISKGGQVHPNGDLASKPWGQIEFSVLDPDNNLITFGQQG